MYVTSLHNKLGVHWEGTPLRRQKQEHCRFKTFLKKGEGSISSEVNSDSIHLYKLSCQHYWGGGETNKEKGAAANLYD